VCGIVRHESMEYFPQPVTGWLKRSMPPEKWTSGKIRSTRLQFSTGPIY
jgi:hypothetical protein